MRPAAPRTRMVVTYGRREAFPPGLRGFGFYVVPEYWIAGYTAEYAAGRDAFSLASGPRAAMLPGAGSRNNMPLTQRGG